MTATVEPLLRIDTNGAGTVRLWGRFVRVRNGGAVSEPDLATGSVRTVPIGDAQPNAEGDYVFEPPGETHTLVVPDHVTEMITLFHVTGGYTYVDPEGNALGYEDVFTKPANARVHYDRLGLGADYANRFVR